MKKLSLVALMIMFPLTAAAQMPYMEEMKALGAISGQGLACGASKYDTFELLARAILLTKSPSDKLQNDAIYTYSEAKANAYMSKEMDGFYDCQALNRRFDNQEIFKAVLYADGTIKMPDGQILTPRRPYDATMIYKKDAKGRTKAKAIYDGAQAQITEVRVKDDTLGVARSQKAVQAKVPAAVEQNVPPPSTIGHISRRMK